MNKTSFLLFIILFSCGNKELPDHTAKQYNYKKNTTKNIYYLNYDLSGDFDVIFNGISLTKNKETGVISGLEYLNPYIAKSGKQTITLILKPLVGSIPPKDVKDYYIDIVYTENGEPAPVNKVMRCSFPAVDKPVDSLTHTWTFEADVPFEINTLSDAKDVTKEDPHSLLQEVVTEYQKVQKLINEGNVNGYMNLYKKSKEREMISMYYDEAKQKEYIKEVNEHVADGKGHMLPLESYKLNISPNGKIIELEDVNGKNILKADNGQDISTYGLQLYRSLKTGKLEVY